MVAALSHKYLVNNLDVDSITKSAVLGSDVRCGVIYTTAFSCGSTFGQARNFAAAISLDAIEFVNNDGLVAAPGTRKRSVDVEFAGQLMERMTLLEHGAASQDDQHEAQVRTVWGVGPRLCSPSPLQHRAMEQRVQTLQHFTIELGVIVAAVVCSLVALFVRFKPSRST